MIVTLVAIPTLLTLFVMAGFLGSGAGAAVLHFPTLLVDNTPTGGDVGAHVLMPQIIRHVLLPSGLIAGWSDAWFAGFPAMYFYFPLPMTTAALLGLVLPAGIALKIVISAGVVALPVVTYFFVRWMGFARLVAAVAASGSAVFVFMESYDIFGGNIKSTLTGEFSFSWSLALGILYLGLIARDMKDGSRFTVWPGVILALVTLSHVVTTIVVVTIAIPWLFRRRTARTVAGSWLLGFGLSAFWSVPFLVGVLRSMTTDMRWTPVTGLLGSEGAVPGDLAPALVLGAIGIVWCVVRKDRVGLLLGLVVVPAVGYLILPRLDVGLINNGRLLPYWYLGMYLFAGIAVGLGVVSLGRLRSGAGNAAARYAILAVVGVAFLIVVSMGDVTHWVDWDFDGYQGKADFDEYSALMHTVDDLPPGRVMWEENADMHRYGTELALMLFPYWSPDHPTMAGVYQESSLTTPFNLINAGELGLVGAERIEGLPYHAMDFERGIAHMAVYGVTYYVSFTEEAAAAARAAGLVPLASVPPWNVFELPQSDLVDVAAFTPSVWSGETGFADVSLSWYDDLGHLDRWLVNDGPAEWPRISSLDDRVSVAPAIESSGAVSDIVIDNGRISFSTTAIGVPHFVKVSYFPNWTAHGATGPYRAAPSLMVVVPTSEHVVLEFSRGWAEYAGIVLTAVSLLMLAAWGVAARRDIRSNRGGE